MLKNRWVISSIMLVVLGVICFSACVLFLSYSMYKKSINEMYTYPLPLPGGYSLSYIYTDEWLLESLEMAKISHDMSIKSISFENDYVFGERFDKGNFFVLDVRTGNIDSYVTYSELLNKLIDLGLVDTELKYPVDIENEMLKQYEDFICGVFSLQNDYVLCYRNPMQIYILGPVVNGKQIVVPPYVNEINSENMIIYGHVCLPLEIQCSLDKDFYFCIDTESHVLHEFKDENELIDTLHNSYDIVEINLIPIDIFVDQLRSSGKWLYRF